MENNNHILLYKYELYRKLIHVCSLIFPISYVYFNKYNFSIIILIFTVMLFIIDVYKNKFHIISNILIFPFSCVTRKYEETSFMSATYMMLGFTIITFFFRKDIVIISMIISILADTTAALFGMKFGKIKLLHNKTLEGAVVFSFTVLFILFLMDYHLMFFQLIIFSLSLSLTELITNTKYDNFSLPILSSIILTILL